MKIKQCEFCGRDYESYGSQKYCSPECKKEGYKRAENMREGRKYKSKHKSHIEAINTEARDLGLTYGQLQAKRYLEAMR